MRHDFDDVAKGIFAVAYPDAAAGAKFPDLRPLLPALRDDFGHFSRNVRVGDGDMEESVLPYSMVSSRRSGLGSRNSKISNPEPSPVTMCAIFIPPYLSPQMSDEMLPKCVPSGRTRRSGDENEAKHSGIPVYCGFDVRNGHADMVKAMRQFSSHSWITYR